MNRALTVRSAATVGAALLMLASAGAQAQSVQLEQYRPAPTPDDGFAIQRPTDPGHLRASFGAHLSYANQPLSFVPDDAPAERVSLVEHQLTLNAMASLGLFERFVVYARLPVSLVMEGQSVPRGPQADGAGLGDLVLGARFLAYRSDDDLFRLAVALDASMPTAAAADSATQLGGEPGVSFWPRLIGELRPHEVLSITASVGGRFRESTQPPALDIGHELTWALGVGVQAVPQYLEVRAETFSSVSLERFGDPGTTPWEILLGVRTRPIEGLQVGLAGSVGLTDGVGNPVFRGVLSVGWIGDGDPLPESGREPTYVEAPPEPAQTEPDATLETGPPPSVQRPPARDPELEPRVTQLPASIARRAGRTPGNSPPIEPEAPPSGEPASSATPPSAPETRATPRARALPRVPSDPRYLTQDRDGDRIVDAFDRCPIDREDYDEIDDDDGCPEEDADDDGMADLVDHCPLTEGRLSNDACSGCPERACMAQGGTIDIREQVRFQTGTDEIREESAPVLQDILSILTTNRQIRRVRIEGHTDSVGDADENRELSLTRARAIVAWLIAHGVTASRLEGWGCGEAHPIQSNERAAGRTRNRRVEFIIVDPSSGRTLREGCQRVP